MGWWYGYDDEEYDEDYGDDCSEDHETPLDAVVIEGPIRALNKRGSFGTQWWGKQWIAAVENFYRDDRLQRGRTYARNGSVKLLEISFGMAYAQVKGHRPFPYCTDITLTPFTNAEWKKALAALGEQAIYSAKLLAGEMPSDIESVFQSVGLSLFPRSLKDIHFDCTCPDDGDPCKHAAAVYDLLAEQIDADPFVLFHLRGRTRDQVLDALRRHRREAATTAGSNGDGAAAEDVVVQPDTLTLALDGFWAAPPNRVHAAPVEPKKPPLLRQYGDPPGGIGKELLVIYRAVTAEAKGWLGL